MNLTKENIKETIRISQKIIEFGLEGKILGSHSQDPEEQEKVENNRRIYHEKIRPLLREFKLRFNNKSPNMIIKSYINDFIKEYELNNLFKISRGGSFYGQKVYPYSWKCMLKKEKGLNKISAPQLYILIDNRGIRFGFCYGMNVKNTDTSVQLLKNNYKISELILKILRDNPELKFYKLPLEPSSLNPKNYDKLETHEDIENNWDKNSMIISFIYEENINDEISDKIEEVFISLLEFFKKINSLELPDIWKCPKNSCNEKEIKISRNEKNQIDASTYKEIISHFLCHLEKKNEYFGSTDIYKIFLNNLSDGSLSEEDKDYYPSYGRSPTIVWKTQIRAALDSLRVNELIASDDPEEISDVFNKDIIDKRKIRLRRRTKKFFDENELYDDWQLYLAEESFESISKPKSLEPDFSNFENSNIDIQKIKNSLLMKKQIILMGPPGTSKSYLAEQIALVLVSDSTKYEIVQFHPSYSYEDFVEGLVTESSKEAPIKFIPKKKVFRIVCEKAKKLKKDEYFVLIIDEINRGNVEKIFGELIWALENRNKPIKTVYMDEDLEIPENLLIIGTMNTVDLSIANIDAALRRRFHIITIMPDEIILKNWLKVRYGDNFPEFQTGLIDLMINLNKKISQDSIYLGPYRRLGHTYFFIESENSIEGLKVKMKIEWEYSIKPLLLEYFNFNYENLKEYEEIYQSFIKKFED